MKLIATISFLVIVLVLYSTFFHETPDLISLPSNAPAQPLTATDLVSPPSNDPAQSLAATDLVLPPSNAPAQSLVATYLVLPPSNAPAESLTAPDLILPPSNASFQSLEALLDVEEASSSREYMRDVHRNKIEFFYKGILIVAVLYFISPTQFPWYYTWMVPLLAVRPKASLLLYPLLLPLYQLNYLSDYIIYIEHIPVLILFILEIKGVIWKDWFNFIGIGEGIKINTS